MLQFRITFWNWEPEGIWLKFLERSRSIVGPPPIGDNNHGERMHICIHILIQIWKHDLYIRMVEAVYIFSLETKGISKFHPITGYEDTEGE